MFYKDKKWLEAIEKTSPELYTAIKEGKKISFDKETLILTIDEVEYQLSLG